MATGLPYCPAKSVILPPGHMMRRLSARGGGYTLSNKALQASLQVLVSFALYINM